MPKWFGFHFPPKEWWFKGPWTFNHPVSHFLGGLAIAPLLLLIWPDMEVWQRLLLVMLIAGSREELQIEFLDHYPVYSAIGDTIFVVLGAALIELIF